MKKKLHQKNRYSVKFAVVFVCVLLCATACKKDQPRPVAPAQPPKAAVPPKPVQKPASSALRLPDPPVNQFDFSNKKDPFKPFVVVKPPPKHFSPGNGGGRPLPDLPIYRYDVNQFKLIGIITGGQGNKAMVTDPAGKGYVLKVGMLIGKNEGKIVVINSGGVDVIEQFKDDNGRVRKENIKLTLPRKQ
jgi:type IV pilus assembly protein PilP